VERSLPSDEDDVRTDERRESGSSGCANRIPPASEIAIYANPNFELSESPKPQPFTETCSGNAIGQTLSARHQIAS
jgi:hypothetical protein